MNLLDFHPVQAQNEMVGCLERRPTRKTRSGGVLPHATHWPSQEGDE